MEVFESYIGHRGGERENLVVRMIVLPT